MPPSCFVLEEALLEKNVKLIQGVSERSGAQIILALKGFSMWSAFPMMQNRVGGVSASSVSEAMLSNQEMGCKAHTYSPAYSKEDFIELLGLSSHISFNSLSQFEHLYPIAQERDSKVSFGLRVNPGYSDVETELYNPASPHSRLGLSPEHLKNGLPKEIEGLHFHTLCESDSFALEQVLSHFEKHFGHLIPQLKWVNMGGGHLMTRKGYDLDHLVKLLKDFQAKHKLKVILEPGSAFAWETGFLKTEILDIIENNGVTTAIINASFTAHMPDTLEMPYRPKVRGASDKLDLPHHYRLGGQSCLAGDFLEEYSFPKPLSIGDTLIFEDMAHYTMVKTTTFNGVPHPAIGILKKDGTFQTVKEFGYLDYKNRLS